jgi:hypothetical protein
MILVGLAVFLLLSVGGTLIPDAWERRRPDLAERLRLYLQVAEEAEHWLGRQ